MMGFVSCRNDAMSSFTSARIDSGRTSVIPDGEFMDPTFLATAAPVVTGYDETAFNETAALSRQTFNSVQAFASHDGSPATPVHDQYVSASKAAPSSQYAPGPSPVRTGECAYCACFVAACACVSSQRCLFRWISASWHVVSIIATCILRTW
jgi:hypothetical protein